MPAPALTIDINARLANLEASLSKVSTNTRATAKTLDSAFALVNSRIRTTVLSLGSLASLSSLANVALGVIKSAEALQDLSDATGSSVESLSRLQNIAKIGGGEFDTYKTALERLAAGMNGAEDGGTKTAQALQFLGVSARDPAQALEQIAQKLSKFADGTGKAALARDIFGRSGVSFLATLKDIATYGDQAGTITTKQAEAASNLADSYRKLQVNSVQLKDAILDGVVPALSQTLSLLNAGVKASGTFGEGLDAALTVALRPGNAASQLDTIRESLTRLKKEAADDKFSLFPSLREQTIRSLEAQEQIALQARRNVGLRLISDDNLDARDYKAMQKPLLPYVSSGAAGPKDDPSRKILEGELKNIDAMTDQLRDVLRTDSDFLDKYYQENLISIKTYFDGKEALRTADLAATVDGLNQDIAAWEAYKGQKGRTQTEIADADKQIIDLTAKRANAERDSAKASSLAYFDLTKATQSYADSVAELDARQKELAGDTAGALAIRLQVQDRAQRATFDANNDPVSTDKLNRQEALLKLQALGSDEARRFSQVQDALGTQIEVVNTLQQAGFITEIDGLNQTSALYRDRLSQLQDLAAAYTAIAQQANDPAMLNQAARLNLEVAKLGTQVDLVADKFNNIGKNAFSSLIQDLSTTGDIKGSLTNFAKNLQGQLSQVFGDYISQAAFGKSGPLSGFGEMFSKLFGGAGGAGIGTVSVQITSLGTASTSTTTTLTTLSTAASAAAEALAQVAVSGGAKGGGFLASLFGGGGSGIGYGTASSEDPTGGGVIVTPYAQGTDYVPRTGLALLHKGERVVTAQDNRKGTFGARVMNVSQTYVIAGPAPSRATQNQIFRAGAFGFQRAAKR